MSSKGEIVRKAAIRGSILATIVYASVGWTSAAAFAQAVVPVASGDTGSASSSFYGTASESERTPYLVIGMADRSETTLHNSFPVADRAATDLSATDTITLQDEMAPAANRTDEAASEPIVLASLTDLRPQSPSARETVEGSHRLASSTGYSLLNDTLSPESFLYGQRPDILSETEWLADNEAPTHEVDAESAGSSPLLELGFGDWSLGVRLYGAGVTQ
jgi:hypothetical protein